MDGLQDRSLQSCRWSVIARIRHLTTFQFVFKKTVLVDGYILSTSTVISIFIPKLQKLQIGAFFLEDPVVYDSIWSSRSSSALYNSSTPPLFCTNVLRPVINTAMGEMIGKSRTAQTRNMTRHL
jgi:hypothetical protein